MHVRGVKEYWYRTVFLTWLLRWEILEQNQNIGFITKNNHNFGKINLILEQSVIEIACNVLRWNLGSMGKQWRLRQGRAIPLWDAINQREREMLTACNWRSTHWHASVSQFNHKDTAFVCSLIWYMLVVEICGKIENLSIAWLSICNRHRNTYTL